MDLRREKSRLSCKRRQSTELFNDDSQTNTSTLSTSTPVRNNNLPLDEDSPYFPCSTQEMNDDVDVLWDWNSPQSKPKTSVTRKSKKKLNLQHSPKVPLRRYPSNNEKIMQDFTKLREGLRVLQELKAEIAIPDHEESLILSPREEEAFKQEKEETHFANINEFEYDNMIKEHIPDVYKDDFQDPFDDDMDEQLILFSQQIESTICKADTRLETNNINTTKKVSNCLTFNNLQSNRNNSSDSSNNINSNAEHSKNKKKFTFKNIPKVETNSDTKPKISASDYIGQNFQSTIFQKKNEQQPPFQSTLTSNFSTNLVKNDQVTNLQESEVFNDSFDNVLSQMDDDDLDQLTQVVDIKQYKNCDNNYEADKKSKGFPRSLSHDMVVGESIQKTSRKVEWHRTQSFESYNAQLSKEKLLEIERKRLEAKAKLDAKKRQEVAVPTVITEISDSDSPLKCSPDEIEKKRLQALEKLEAKRLQDIIEKKKQEALKRREENRKKKAANVKSSLSTRL